MSEGPTIGDWTQYEWIPDDASSFPARVRLRDAAWMVYYEPDAVVQRERAERLELCERICKLEELAFDLYCLAFPSTVSWKVSDETHEKYSPCEMCEKAHGGKSPCASTSRDMTDECCNPFRAVVVADRMRELGIEVPDA